MTDNFSIDSILSSKNEIETGTFTDIPHNTDITALLLPSMYCGVISDLGVVLFDVTIGSLSITRSPVAQLLSF